MTDFYFPGCNYTRHAPMNSEKIQKYIFRNYNLKIAGCCSCSFQDLTAQDRAVYICPTCAAIIQESAPQAQIISIWEFLQSDDNFPWPDFENEKICLQDCWRQSDNKSLHQAVRQVLTNCRINIIENAHNREKSRFCGITLLKPPSPRYYKLAPQRFIDNAHGFFTPHSEPEQEKLMFDYCSRFSTNKVICYCTGCLEGLQKGGKQGLHLMDIITSKL